MASRRRSNTLRTSPLARPTAAPISPARPFGAAVETCRWAPSAVPPRTLPARSPVGNVSHPRRERMPAGRAPNGSFVLRGAQRKRLRPDRPPAVERAPVAWSDGRVQDEPGQPANAPWWRSAVIYQIYPRSFADSDGDGIGDLPGIRSRLPYLRELGVDAVWISPFYPSPMADAGYDVSDYRDVEPIFGTLADADALLADAHELGIRVIIDLVPNHTSDEHAWFRAALAAAPGQPGARPVHLPGRAAASTARSRRTTGSATSAAPAWTRVTEADGSAGQWYLHLFDPKQPDLDWTNPEVRRRVRVDPAVLAGPRRRRVPHRRRARPGQGPGDAGPGRATRATGGPAVEGHPHWDRDEVHDVYRGVAAGHRLVRRRPGVRRRGLGADARAAGPLPAPRRAAHRVQLRPTCSRRGTPRRCARRSTTASTRSAPSARRRPGCCPTTTSSGTSPGTAVAVVDPATTRPRLGHAAAPGPRRC